ncbi:hypothetical protein DERP_004304 [Dermatophagoides pteronyssinus]|uniref:Uncharacterized protein n=1 Tax=Dermatophagoides pteronyssinus TaxID=6956 RepID=A0ABQ8JNW0_DERPT|nr:hypothetical protein DERP_004304 [Dermatophagoides pteronyssinus]
MSNVHSENSLASQSNHPVTFFSLASLRFLFVIGSISHCDSSGGSSFSNDSGPEFISKNKWRRLQ